jgi:phosphoribosyl 1,2-cyclic phosphodiesterase
MHSSALVNDDLLIDLGPDLIAAAVKHNLRLNDIPYALQTHPHADHLDGITLFARARKCEVEGLRTIALHCSTSAVSRMDEIVNLPPGTSFRDPANQADFALAITEVVPWQAFTVGPYRVQSVEANHDMGIEAMLYAIEDTRSGDRLFYGTDTGPLPGHTWQRLADLGWAFDLFILDHTFGFGARSTGHLNQEQFLEEIAAARAAGLITDPTRVIGTHIAHHSHPAHTELARLASARGYEIAYDGWAVETATPSPQAAIEDRLVTA